MCQTFCTRSSWAKIKPILDHNHDRLHRLNASKTQEMHRAVDRYLEELSRSRAHANDLSQC